MPRLPDGKILWRAAAMLTVLLLLWGCCTTSPVAISPPKISWPGFPDPTGSVGILSEDTVVPKGAVVMKLDYWLAVARYAVDVETVRKIIAAWADSNGEGN